MRQSLKNERMQGAAWHRLQKIWQGSSKDSGYLKGEGKGEEQEVEKNQESDLYQQK